MKIVDLINKKLSIWFKGILRKFKAYVTKNRQVKYKVTISNDMLRNAFRSYDDLNSLISLIENSLYNENECEVRKR